MNDGDITFKNSNEKADMNILSVDYFNMSLLKQHSILFSECAHNKHIKVSSKKIGNSWRQTNYIRSHKRTDHHSGPSLVCTLP